MHTNAQSGTALMAQPLRPTVIRFGRFGDMVMLTALDRRPCTSATERPCQVVGAGPWNADIFRAHPDVGDGPGPCRGTCRLH